MNAKASFVLGCVFVSMFCACTEATAANFTYDARLTANARVQGKVIASGITWGCRDDICTTSGPWAIPGVGACNALARQVGEVVSYGHWNRRLSKSDLARCNAGVANTRAARDAARQAQPGGLTPGTLSASAIAKLRGPTALKVSIDQLKFTRRRSYNSPDISVVMGLWYTVTNSGAEFRIDKAPSGNNVSPNSYVVRVTGHDEANNRALFTVEDRLRNAVSLLLSPGQKGTGQRTIYPHRQQIGQIFVSDIPHNMQDIRVTAEVLLRTNVNDCFAVTTTEQTFMFAWELGEGGGVYRPRPRGRPASTSSFGYSRRVSCPRFLPPS